MSIMIEDQPVVVGTILRPRDAITSTIDRRVIHVGEGYVVCRGVETGFESRLPKFRLGAFAIVEGS